MKKFNLPFEIGQDYENWEFDLEITDLERLPNYDSYSYLGGVKKFLNIISDKTELIFYWDRLEAVILTFLNVEINSVEKFKIELKYKCHFPIYLVYSNFEIYKYRSGNLKLYLIWEKSNTLIVLYGNSISLEEIYSSILNKILE